MEVSPHPFTLGPGFVQEPQPGARQQVNPELQVKANAAAPAPEAAPVPAQAGPSATAPDVDETLRGLAAEGRLPPRGSLLDLRA